MGLGKKNGEQSSDYCVDCATGFLAYPEAVCHSDQGVHYHLQPAEANDVPASLI